MNRDSPAGLPRWRRGLRRAGLYATVGLALGYLWTADRLPWWVPQADANTVAVHAVSTTGPAGLDALLSPDLARAPTIDPLVSYKTAEALLALGPKLSSLEAAARESGLPASYATALTILESDGEVLPYPRAYAADVATAREHHKQVPTWIPRGPAHVKPADLDSVLAQARDGERFYKDLLGSRWNEAVDDGWTAIEHIDEILTPSEREHAIASFGSEAAAARVFGLAAILANKPDPTDLLSTRGGIEAAGAMTAYNALRLRSLGLPVTDSTLFDAYTSGPNNAIAALEKTKGPLDAASVRRMAQESAGSWGVWYVESGAQILGLFERFGSVDAAQRAAKALAAFHGEHEDATRATLGTGFAWMASDPNALEKFKSWYAKNDTGANINEALVAYANVAKRGALADR